ncbi:MAG: tRNA (adenosine(37)-N6)-threonylcarbamoyltransferase complex dimerization subunit type 1 TsaB [Negativicutes bacterium]|jgi:tRNA threonylcarbamoyladenosine biosynthesis protein TsaB|nr:tRNA (adenosine(37)-N6)-threonylcarbamoyltransferase complex dimerization subunit type 1 TsaB [Negativicutes bacterium]
MGKNLILALETSSLVSSIALIEESKLRAEITIENSRHHSENLVPHIEQLFSLGAVKKEDLSAVAVAVGPGSFTGLRIGIGTAKSIAYGLGIPIIGISTLKGLAWNLYGEGSLLCPIMDAQKNNVYTAIFEVRNGQMIMTKEESVESIETIFEWAKENPRLMLLGEGNRGFEEKLAQYGLNAQRPLPHLKMPRASSIGYAALERFLAQDFDSVMDLAPNYIRRSEAEELWEKKQLLEK